MTTKRIETQHECADENDFFEATLEHVSAAFASGIQASEEHPVAFEIVSYVSGTLTIATTAQ